jgi:hypothetical protein
MEWNVEQFQGSFNKKIFWCLAWTCRSAIDLVEINPIRFAKTFWCHQQIWPILRWLQLHEALKFRIKNYSVCLGIIQYFTEYAGIYGRNKEQQQQGQKQTMPNGHCRIRLKGIKWMGRGGMMRQKYRV